MDCGMPGSMSFTLSLSLLKLMSTESVISSSHLILCHLLLTISSSVTSFSSCPQSFPASESFPVSQLFASGSQSIGASASTPVLPMNIQGWFPLGLISLISLLSSGLSRVFSSTTGRKHQFFSTLSSLWSNSHIHTWLLLETSHNFDYMGLCQQSDISAF